MSLVLARAPKVTRVARSEGLISDFEGDSSHRKAAEDQIHAVGLKDSRQGFTIGRVGTDGGRANVIVLQIGRAHV